MEARGFGNGRRTRYASAPIDRAAIVVIACSVAAIVVTIAARLSGVLPDWYPFPHVTVPDAGLLPLSAVALLLAPLVVWRRS
jgi:hypothetical protein